MREDYTVVYEARTVPEAHELIDRLGDAGIEAVVVEEVAQSQAGTDAIGFPSPFSVAVGQEEADAARHIAEAFDDEHIAQVEHEAQSPAATEPVEPLDKSEESDLWPRCPECDARRITVCPICKTSGSHLPLADADYSPPSEETAERQPMVLCPTCDEPFIPQYLRHCEWCDHDFGAGIEPNHDPVSEPISPGVMGAILGAVQLSLGVGLLHVILY